MKSVKKYLFAAVIALACVSCQKNDAPLEDSDILINQEVLSEVFLSELDMLAEEVIDLQLGMLKSASAGEGFTSETCPLVTYDHTSTPKVLTLDFGTGCIGRDGKTRAGKIIITSVAFENPLVKRVSTFDNFMVEERKIEGTISKTITFNRENFSRIAVIEEDVTITFEDNKVASRKGNLTREHQMGLILDRTDDKVITWGEVKTTRQSGVVVTKTIAQDTPLVFMVSCRQIVSGIAIITVGANQTWSIDYGQGECDNKATVTRGTDVRIVRLGK